MRDYIENVRRNHEQIIDNVNLDSVVFDIFWIKDKSLADLDNLPEPDVLAADITENFQSALEGFQELMQQLENSMFFAV